MKQKRFGTIIAILSVALVAILAIDATPETQTNLEAESMVPRVSAASSSIHDIEMEAVEMPDGLYAYRMVKHEIDEADVTAERYGSSTPKPSIPGPTIVLKEGDVAHVKLVNKVSCDKFPKTVNGISQTPHIAKIGIHVHGVHYDITDDATPKRMNMVADSAADCGGDFEEYTWTAAPGSEGAWPYHDHTFTSENGGEDVGLFGTVIINPGDGQVEALVDGTMTTVDVTDISKDYVLWMVSTEQLGRSIFYGMEIDNDLDTDGDSVGRQTPLWVNPVLLATEDELVRFHILGLGDEFHSFHIHGHKWSEPKITNVIDVKTIGPLTKESFIVKAGEGVGPGDWMYHCHVFAHMQQGMSSMFRVLPSGSDDTLPQIGAVFTLSDEPGLWMKTINAGVVDALDPRDGIGFPLDKIAGALVPGSPFADSQGRSLAVITPGQSVIWNMKDSQTLHTITSIIWPTGATRGGDSFPFDRELNIRGTTYMTDNSMKPATLTTPGLYVFTCKIHPYMFSAVIVDDPATTSGALPALDLGPSTTILTRTDPTFSSITTTVPSLDPLVTGLVTTFYVATDPSNWKDYTKGTWEVNLPPVPVTDGTTTVSLSALDIGPMAISATPPSKKGIGQVLVDTQFEETINKNHPGTPSDKPGTITYVDAKNWSIEKKVALPDINMNHPHNMWTDTTQSVIYQTQWFDSRMVAFDRETGEIIKDTFVGQSPSHVMTSPLTEKIYIAMNGEEQVTEIDPITLEVTRQISVGEDSHPHGHWISSDGRFIVTPNFFKHNTSIIDLSVEPPLVKTVATGITPIATGMKPDSSKYYTADFLGNSLTVVDPHAATKLKTVDLLLNGTGLPIQTPVSPDGKWMVTANVLGAKITVLDTSNDKIVKVLSCDPGCHGVQWGAKKDGGYFAYVSNKFSNALIVVDPDPNKDGDATDAAVVGKVLLTKQYGTSTDDKIINHAGMGGQGVLAIPNVYKGWIQNTVSTCGNHEDPCSQEVVDFLKDLKNDQKNP